MKKLLVLSAVAAMAASAFGQGQVQFSNRETSVTPAISAPIYLDSVGVGTVGALSGNTYRAALVGGTTTATPFVITTAGVSGGLGMNLLAQPGTGTTWATFRTGAASGLIAVGGDTARTVTDVNWGTAGKFQVVAWSGAYDTFAAAIAAALTDKNVKIGASAPVTVTLPPDVTNPNLAYLQGLTSFAIVSVPEPSSFALAGLGAAALMIFRRRK